MGQGRSLLILGSIGAFSRSKVMINYILTLPREGYPDKIAYKKYFKLDRDTQSFALEA